MAESEISRINRNLGIRFNNMDSFTRFVESKYRGKLNEFVQFEKDLEVALNVINDYCNGIFVEKISAETVRIWHSRINALNESIKSISYHINMTMLDYEAHVDAPEKFFLKQMDEEFDSYGEDEDRFKKYSNYVAEIAEDYQLYNKYIQLSSHVLNRVMGQFQQQFANYIPLETGSLNKGKTKKQLQNQLVNSPNLVLNDLQKRVTGNQDIDYRSFNYIKEGKDRYDRIKSLFEYFKQKNLIDKKTKEVYFIDLFIENSIRKPVNWIGNAGHLGYFLISMKEQELLSGEDENKIWVKAEKCFLIKGKSIKIGSLKTNTDPMLKTVIDNALKILK